MMWVGRMPGVKGLVIAIGGVGKVGAQAILVADAAELESLPVGARSIKTSLGLGLGLALGLGLGLGLGFSLQERNRGREERRQPRPQRPWI